MECGFVESTDRGDYCCLNHCACESEGCAVLEHGLTKEDINDANAATEEIRNQRG